MNKLVDTTSFVDCEDIAENTATFDFNTKVLKQGKANLPKEQINRIGLIIATDFKNFAESGGNLSTLSANAVYTHLQNTQQN